jgi:hypothetical protein
MSCGLSPPGSCFEPLRGTKECRSRNPALLPVQENHPLLLERVEELFPTDALEVFPVGLSGKIYTQRSLAPNHPRGLSTVLLCPPADFTVVRGAPVVHWGPLSGTSQPLALPLHSVCCTWPVRYDESHAASNTVQGAISSGTLPPKLSTHRLIRSSMQKRLWTGTSFNALPSPAGTRRGGERAV